MTSPLLRILGFLATLLIVSMCVAIVMSQAGLPTSRAERMNLTLGLTVGCVGISYVLGYRPGYLVRWVLGADEQETK